MKIDTELLNAKVVFEDPANVGETAPKASWMEDNWVCPHVYGPINRSSVVEIGTISRAEDGEFLSVNFS